MIFKKFSEKSLLLQALSYSDETLELKKIRYESLLEKSKFSNILISVGAIVVTLVVIATNIEIYQKEIVKNSTLFAMITFEIFVLFFSYYLIKMVELRTRILKVYEYEIDRRAKEKKIREKEQEKSHLEKQAIVEKREKILKQKYRK